MPGLLFASTAAALAVAAVAGTGSTAAAPGDPFRPAMHYTPARNWMNDPNGLVYHDGRYHLFYQHNPSGPGWANMSWGHAVSTDLRTWREQPIAIRGDRDAQTYSGSAVVDHGNTSGFGTAGNPPMVAIYTARYRSGRQAQSLAYSTDDGRTWTRYRGNPVLDRGSKNFRDPKVFWYSPPNAENTGGSGGYWVMTAVEALDRKVVLYRSDDLLTWRPLSEFGPGSDYRGIWECPDLFPLPVDGNPGTTKWVLVVSHNPATVDVLPPVKDISPTLLKGTGTRYFVGDFDGTRFTADGPPRFVDDGRDFYAGVTFNDAPAGKRIMMAWMSNWLYAQQTPTGRWRGAMTLPRELSLRTVGGRPTLISEPVAGQGSKAYSRHDITVGPGAVTLPVKPRAYRVHAVFRPGTAERLGLTVRRSAGGAERTRISYDIASGTLSLDRTRSGNVFFGPVFPSVDSVRVPLRGGKLTLDVYVDASSVEVFAQDGAHTITDLVFPSPSSNGISVDSDGGRARLDNLTVTATD